MVGFSKSGHMLKKRTLPNPWTGFIEVAMKDMTKLAVA